MECKHCGAPLEAEEALCPVCGKEQTEPAEETPAAEISVEEAPAEETPVEEAPAEEAPAEEAPANPKRKLWMRILAIVCCVSLAVTLILGIWLGVTGGFTGKNEGVSSRSDYTATNEQLLKGAKADIATIGTESLTNAQLQVFYWMEVYHFMEQYGAYLAYLGFDTAKPLSEQYVAEGVTYQQYFLNTALNNWHNYMCLKLDAEAKGHTMSEEMQAEVDRVAESMEATAGYYGYASADEMIQADMGPAANLELYVTYMELYLRAMDYMDSIYAAQKPDAAAVEAYYAEHAEEIAENYGVNSDSGNLVDVRHILLIPEGGTKDESGVTVYSDEEWEACRQAAEALLNQWKQGEATEESFARLAGENTADPGSADNGGLYTKVYPGQMVEEFDAWCFHAARQYGDTDLVRTTYGYHIMYFVNSEPSWLAYAEQDMIAAACTQILDAAKEANPMRVRYNKIRIADIDLAG